MLELLGLPPPNSRPPTLFRPIAFTICSLSLLTFLSFLTLYSFVPDQEPPMLYAPHMCKSSPSLSSSRLASICPLPDGNNEGESVDILLPLDTFLPSLAYVPTLFLPPHVSGTIHLSLSQAPPNNDLLFSTQSHPIVFKDGVRISPLSAPARSLLKGGSGSASNTRSSRYHARRYRRTPSLRAPMSDVAIGSVLQVHHPYVPPSGRGGSINTPLLYAPDTIAECIKPRLGCDVKTMVPLVRHVVAEQYNGDSLAFIPITTSGPRPGPDDMLVLSIRVENMAWEPPAGMPAIPPVFVGFYTPDETLMSLVEWISWTGFSALALVIAAGVTCGYCSDLDTRLAVCCFGERTPCGLDAPAGPWVGRPITPAGAYAGLHGLPPLDPGPGDVQLAFVDGDRVSTALDEEDLGGRQVGEITHLDFFHNDIFRIAPMAPFSQLVFLSLRSNDLRDLGGLTAAKSLRFLDVADNNLTSLAPLSNHPSLAFLEASHNDLARALDLSSPSIVYLSVADNDLTSLPRSHLPSLMYLDASNNNLTSVPGLAHATSLRHVYLQSNDIAHPGSIAEFPATCPNLVIVDVSDNDLSSRSSSQLRDAFSHYGFAHVLRT